MAAVGTESYPSLSEAQAFKKSAHHKVKLKRMHRQRLAPTALRHHASAPPQNKGVPRKPYYMGERLKRYKRFRDALTPLKTMQYLLREQEEKLNVGTEPVADVVKTLPEEAAPKEDLASVVESSPVIPSATDDESSVISGDAVSSEEVESGDNNLAASEESNQDAADDSADVGQDASEDEPPEIKLETAPADFRFPTTNQSRHCFTRYVEFHRCVASKGDSAPECDKFAKYYRSLCPGEWVDRWNEQRENGTFPGPL